MQPERIGDILPDVMLDIRRRMIQYSEQHRRAVLDAEVRIGEILKAIPIDKSYTGYGRREPVLPEGISHNLSSQCQQLADYPGIVEQVKAEAVENEDIPTRSEVMRKIKEKKRQENIDEQKENIGKLKSLASEFDIIVIDPPWPYGGQYNPDGHRAGRGSASLVKRGEEKFLTFGENPGLGLDKCLRHKDLQ